MSVDYERLLPRSFTGLSDAEWHQFDTIVKSFLGRGKRSLFLCIMVRKAIEIHRNQFEQRAKIEQRAEHSVNDAFSSLFGKDRFDNGISL